MFIQNVFFCVDHVVPVNTVSVMSGRLPVFLGLTSTKQKMKCVAQVYNTMPRTIDPFDPKSNTIPTEQLRSSHKAV